jgi:hypothetical protein
MSVKGNSEVNGKIVSKTLNVTDRLDSPLLATTFLVIDKSGGDWGAGMSIYGGQKEPFYINYFTGDDTVNRKGFVKFGFDNTTKVYFDGGILVNGDIHGKNLNTGYKLLHYQLPDNADHDTGYSSDWWVLTVAGVNIDWVDNSLGALKVYTYIKDNKWYLRSEIEGPREDSGIYVLAIPKANFDEVTAHQISSGAGY